MNNYSLYYKDDGQPVEGIDRHYPCREITYNVAFPDGCTWHGVMQEFARFLDATGYVGVGDAIDDFVNGYAMEGHYEDTSNPGLSD